MLIDNVLHNICSFLKVNHHNFYIAGIETMIYRGILHPDKLQPNYIL